MRIGVVGDFNPSFHSHHATNAALRHAAERLALPVDLEWVPTPRVLEDPKDLAGYDGVWLSPGSPYQSLEGALRAVEFARVRDRPFVGT
jgi:CTP synthase (UTP-ammonia lyase)